MKKIMKVLIFLLILSITTPCIAEQKYNPFTQEWETTSYDAELQYHPFNEEWSYQQPESTLEYSPFNETWDFCPPSQRWHYEGDGYGNSYRIEEQY